MQIVALWLSYPTQSLVAQILSSMLCCLEFIPLIAPRLSSTFYAWNKLFLVLSKVFLNSGIFLISTPRRVKISHKSFGSICHRFTSLPLRKGFISSADDSCSAISDHGFCGQHKGFVQTSFDTIIKSPFTYSPRGFPALRSFSSSRRVALDSNCHPSAVSSFWAIKELFEATTAEKFIKWLAGIPGKNTGLVFLGWSFS